MGGGHGPRSPLGWRLFPPRRGGSLPSASRKFFVIVNPTSGGGAGVGMPAVLERELGRRGLDYAVRVTDGAGHATELARAAVREQVYAVVAVGGDGTVHETVNGLLREREAAPDSRAALGLVPVGTGNDFVKVVRGASPRGRAIRTLADGVVRWFDAGYAEWEGGSEYFVNAAGTGIDVEVVRAMASRRGGPGAWSYISALLRALRRYRPVPIGIRADGHSFDGEVMTVAIANGRCIGGSFRICPDARPDDGWLDLCAVRQLGLLASVGAAARILRGTHTGLPAVWNARAQRAELTVPGDRTLSFQLDGELRESDLGRSLRIEVRPGVLPVLTLPG